MDFKVQRCAAFGDLSSGDRQAPYLSTVILGLDPRIRNPLKSINPRVKPEDDTEYLDRKNPQRSAAGFQSPNSEFIYLRAARN
ncbi:MULTISPECIES: hypothetical protein [unclassified Agrobacterium]|uniref:hypothetical protein n=1 Tax=unclassified Agrobacterium TaxID=2632611 RepID=UPI00244BEA93|nr:MULTISPECIES: hypothetical protein [unclassified Agrobacterium]MDH0613267.1 hypothetical protein [Agrobacterium sp. GD03872]MDH0695132.1 hypothetical protein [Agrobacterium sp. GD03871]MDH1057470.1 hypothetical protein [Agrobacterium sp. GD03992]MDH2208759.1 hypothetical protein [Agrobacterium sp. GD03643]MDH2222724.1 hypothetical protein [Agrobacterium sp. GD03638]